MDKKLRKHHSSLAPFFKYTIWKQRSQASETLLWSRSRRCWGSGQDHWGTSVCSPSRRSLRRERSSRNLNVVSIWMAPGNWINTVTHGPSSWIGILVVPVTSSGSQTRTPDASLWFTGCRISRHLACAGPSVSERIEDRSFLGTYDWCVFPEESPGSNLKISRMKDYFLGDSGVHPFLPLLGPRVGALGRPRTWKGSGLGTYSFSPDFVSGCVRHWYPKWLPEGLRRREIAYLCPTWRGQKERQMF